MQGNNDGKNLSAPQQFRSKEISKSNVVDDMVNSNKILYADGKGPDHTVTRQIIYLNYQNYILFLFWWRNNNTDLGILKSS